MELPDFLTRTEHGDIDLTGHRIGLAHVVNHFNEGWSAEMIVSRYPTLGLAHVYKAIAFYLENKAAVDEYIREYDAEMEQLRANAKGPNWDLMRQRLEAMRLAALKPAEV
jgi:uncharacterized protein (DUF433 family)